MGGLARAWRGLIQRRQVVVLGVLAPRLPVPYRAPCVARRERPGLRGADACGARTSRAASVRGGRLGPGVACRRRRRRWGRGVLGGALGRPGLRVRLWLPWGVGGGGARGG